jgi:hypothetical protein
MNDPSPDLKAEFRRLREDSQRQLDRVKAVLSERRRLYAEALDLLSSARDLAQFQFRPSPVAASAADDAG